MLERTKNLYKDGTVKEGIFSSKSIIMDIPRKIKLFKAYKLQLTQLGFIASGTQIHENRKPIDDIVNGQINRQDPTYRKSHRYANSLSLVARYFKNPKQLDKNNPIYEKFVSALDNKYEGRDKTTIVINRMYRRNKGEAMYKRVEELQGL